MPYVRADQRRKIGALLFTTILASGVVAPAHAQVAGQANPPPVRRQLDENGVDVVTGAFVAPVAELSIGAGGTNGLSYGLTTDGVTTTLGTIEDVGGKIVVTVGGKSDSFTSSGGTYTSEKGEGAALVLSAGTYIYTSRDGIEARFASNAGYSLPFYEGELARLGSIKYPDGSLKEFAFRVTLMCTVDYDPEAPSTCYGERYYVARLQSVRSSDGYQMRFNYAFNDSPTKVTLSNYGGWGKVTGVVAFNQAVQFCDAVATTCSITGNWPSLSFGLGTVTDSLSRTTTYGFTGVTRPGGVSINATYNAGKVQSVTNAGIIYNYGYADAGNTRTTTVTAPDGGQKVYTGDLTTFLMTSFRDEQYRTTSYQYDANGRVTRITSPEGNYTQYTYDARGNVLETRNVAKSASGLADIVMTASFPATCSNAKTCNQPIWIRDSKNNQTDFTYDASHGGMLTVTAPAGSSGGIRPQTRYSYTSLNSYFKVYSNSITVGYAHQKLTGISSCQTTASCVATSDEIKTTVAYGPQVAGTANNLLPVNVAKGAGNNSLTASVALGYDNIGNMLTVDGLLSGAADTTRTRYDAARQVIGLVGPDPDGVGARKHLAQRFTYNSNGQLTNSEIGNVNSQSDADWTAMTVSQSVATTYDVNARPIKQDSAAAGTVYTVAQSSYDNLGRIECSAVRMNPAIFASLPSSACALGTQGSGAVDFGPDRIVKTTYNASGEPTKIQTAYGTSEQADEVTKAYTANGKLDYVIDAENNRTDYTYDGFDRGVKVEYPSATKGANAVNAGDYEQISYDSNGNTTVRRLRDGNSINYSYDNLNRMVLKDLPGNGVTDADVTYSHDLLGRLTTAIDTNGHVATLSYDALGRKRTEASLNGGTKTSDYDLTGRRTRLTWPDGFFVSYDYDAAGNMTSIRENGATSGVGVLAAYSYDDIGRRSSFTRGNGTVTRYAFDAVSRLSALSQDLGGTANDQTSTLTYNPVGQIDSLAKSNDAYAWGGHYNVERGYGSNGLNQLTAAGSTALGYDGRGNLTASGASTFGYNAKNQLVALNGVTQLYYEPLGRLTQQWNGGGILDWDGQDLVAESNGASPSVITRRYVPGPTTDETVVWYEGAGLSDRRWLHTDERGSVTAVTNSAGGTIAINTYDEYGIPAATNIGRFQYTGQAWLPEIGMYYYKARFYSPTLGRFLQTDPAGYADGINWYNYVGSDPVNKADPTGLRIEPVDLTATKPIDPNELVVNGPRFKCLSCAFQPPADLFGHSGSFAGPASAGNAGGERSSAGTGQSADICNTPLSGDANRGQTINSRRAQVRRELRQATREASKTGGDVGAAVTAQFGVNISRLSPNIGTWIKGGTSKPDGNYLYGAITAELGIPLYVALKFADAAEWVDDALDLVGLGDSPDEGFGNVDQSGADQIRKGAQCPG